MFTMRAPSLCCAAMLFGCLAAVRSAHAQTPAVQPPQATPVASDTEYEALIKSGLAEYNLGHTAEAKAYFLRAHAVRPSARTLRGLGLVCYEQRLYVAAVGYLEQALVHAERPLTPEMRSEVEQRLRESRSFVSHVTLKLTPANLGLRVDGKPPVFDRDGSMMLDLGTRELIAEAPGYKTHTRRVDALGADHGELRIELEPAAAVIAEAPSSAAPAAAWRAEPVGQTRERGFWETRSTLQWVGLGLGAGAIVAAGIGVGFGVAAIQAKNAAADSCTSHSCDDHGRAQRQAALDRADIATVSFISAGVLLVGGTACYLLAPTREHATAAIRFAPLIGRSGALLQVSGRL